MSTAVLDSPLAPVSTPAPPRPRLSDALRHGARFHPQGTNVLYNRQTGATCALGAVLVALVGPGVLEVPADDINVTELIYAQTGTRLDLPVPGSLRALCRWPLEGAFPWTLGMAIVHLNDRMGWSREAIADRLEALGF